jgi:hypothetical protein
MIFLSFVPLITVLVGMGIVTSEIKCTEFVCIDIVQDVLDCDVFWCYDECGCGCSCCTCNYAK